MPTQFFPNLSDFALTSPRTTAYNCIAWACGDNTKWWWPDGAMYWPPNIRCEESIQAFDDLFISGGAFRVADEGIELDVVKIALFAKEDKPTHAARQLLGGKWTSKLGNLEDISHRLREIEGKLYGNVVQLYGVKIR